jgi:predicted nuclease with RNAse H fold
MGHVMQMVSASQTVVGIDVGGLRKGFHAVALTGKAFRIHAFAAPGDAAAWCKSIGACVVAVDAPCGWSATGRSRRAERELHLNGEKIHCFATPSEARARTNRTGFYEWVFNGMALYSALQQTYPLFSGSGTDGPVCFETFPQAVACALAGRRVPAKQKAAVRRRILSEQGYDHRLLGNIDYVDAALCAVAAAYFRRGAYSAFGCREEGWILMPKNTL